MASMENDVIAVAVYDRKDALLEQFQNVDLSIGNDSNINA